MDNGRSLWASLVLLNLLITSRALLTPRISFPLGSPGRPLTVFNMSGVDNTTTLLLSNDENTLFVGARDSILALDISHPWAIDIKNRLDWSPTEKDLADCSMKGKKKTDCPNFVRVLQVLNSTHMYACGTFAFSPRCTYINTQNFALATGPSGKPEEGRGRSPYDPYQKNIAITVDGELYTGTVADYMGNRPVISRHLSEGSHVDLKLDDTPGWLEEPTFISSAFVRGEEKVYFFFSEVGREYDFLEKFTVSRIAQVCTSDVGGQRTLQKRWTTFAKAQLLCQAEKELPYNVLQDVFTLSPPEGASDEDTLFYGIFRPQWPINSGRSAVCAFSLGDIKAVFSGNYKVLNRDSLRWTTRVQEKIANPGECGLHNASDNTLRFVKENFLADASVQPTKRRITLASADQDYSNIAAQRVRAANGKEHTVLYLLTELGYLHKAVLLEEGAHIIEEVQVFRQPQPMKNLLLSLLKGSVFIGTSEGVTRVPLSNCSFYPNCAECVLARDPFCGWDHSRGLCADVSTIQGSTGQDVDGGNVSVACRAPPVVTPRSSRPTAASCELVLVSLNEVVRLKCPEASRLATRHWQRPNSRLSPDLYLKQQDGSLQFLATPITLGHYMCQAEENGFQQTLAIYQVKQKSSTTLHPPTTTRHQGKATVEVGKLAPTPRSVPPKQPDIRAKEPELAVTKKDANAGSTRRTGRNFTLWFDSSQAKQPRDSVGEEPLHGTQPSYLQELVVVSVLLALCISILLTIALYGLRQRCRGRTITQVCPRKDAERGTGAATPQERESLQGHSPRTAKCNGQAQNGQAQNGKSPISISNGSLSGSNGHLPNTPI
ncbi:semaphorin-4A [Chanos chanos]|uniref:Semaphorin-4A n=1 Tax=Chanos chanos TaxID=29144 RepID=A0A6J2WKZ5_CHACN|nr:semaphorin-4A-like [Chanos chanos]